MTKFIQQTQTVRNWSWIYHINFNFVSSNILVSCKWDGLFSTMGNGPVRSSHLLIHQPKNKEKEDFFQNWVDHACPPPLFRCHFSKPKLIAIDQGLTSYIIGGQIPAQPNLYTLYKSDQCSSMHELFSDFLVSYESWDYKLFIYINFFPKNHMCFIWQQFQKCNVF